MTKESNSDFKVNGNLCLVGKTEIRLPHQIEKCLTLKDRLYFLCLAPVKVRYNDNIFCFNRSGVKLWQVESQEHSISSDNPFVDMFIEDKTKILLAHKWDGGEFRIDSLDGSILSSRLLK